MSDNKLMPRSISDILQTLTLLLTQRKNILTTQNQLDKRKLYTPKQN